MKSVKYAGLAGFSILQGYDRISFLLKNGFELFLFPIQQEM